MFIWRGKYDLFFGRESKIFFFFFFLLLFERYILHSWRKDFMRLTDALVRNDGSVFLRMKQFMDVFVMFSQFSFCILFVCFFLVFLKGTSTSLVCPPLFWGRNAYWIVGKIQRQFNNVCTVCFGDFYLFIGNFCPVSFANFTWNLFTNFYAYSFQCTFTFY